MASLTPSSSTTPASVGTGTLQAMADPETQTFWFGGETADQDVRIRLVRDIINNEVDDGRTLAYLMVHSSRLETSSSYFAAALSQRWSSERKRIEEFTFHVHGGDVQLYTDCFSRMYNQLMADFESVEYSLQLLPLATRFAYDDLMSSICFYLASICPWSGEEEMRIRSSVLSEDFPRGHAQDLLERLERRLTIEDFRPLITTWMQSSPALSKRSARQGKKLFIHLLTPARLQEQSPTLTFKQNLVTLFNEEFKLLLVQVNEEFKAAHTEEEADAIIRRLEAIRCALDVLVAAGTADEGVKWFVRYDACFRRLRATALHTLGVPWFDTNVTDVADAFAGTVLSLLMKVMTGGLYVNDSDLTTLLMKWLSLLQWVYQEALGDVGAMSNKEFEEGYEEVMKVLVRATLSKSQQITLFRRFEREDLI